MANQIDLWQNGYILLVDLAQASLVVYYPDHLVLLALSSWTTQILHISGQVDGVYRVYWRQSKAGRCLLGYLV